MHPLDDTDDSGNECNGENRLKMSDTSYWDVVYKNRRQAFSAVGGMINEHVQRIYSIYGNYRASCRHNFSFGLR